MSGKTSLERRIKDLEVESGIGSAAGQYVLRIIFGQGMKCKGDYREIRWLMAKDEDPKGRFVRVLEPGEIIGDEPSWLKAVLIDEVKRRQSQPPPIDIGEYKEA